MHHEADKNSMNSYQVFRHILVMKNIECIPISAEELVENEGHDEMNYE